MSTSTQDVKATAAALHARGKALGNPFVHFGGSQHLAGDARWSKIYDLLPAELDAVAEQLAAYEAQAEREAAGAARTADVIEGRAAVVPDAEVAARFRRDAAADLARHVAERPARVEALLQRIADSLDALAKR